MITSMSCITRRSGVILKGERKFFDKVGRDWEKAWAMNITPWDLKGTVCPPLVQAIEKGNIIVPKNHNLKALVPGCGTGYECIYLRNVGFSKVVGLDLSKTAVAHAQENLNKTIAENAPSTVDSVSTSEVHFICDNFFHIEDSTARDQYDFIFDYCFFVALDPPNRKDWALSMSKLLLPETGTLATLLFPLYNGTGSQNEGPPYPVTLQDYEQVLHPLGFEVYHVEKDVKSVTPRLGKEMMVYWKLKN